MSAKEFRHAKRQVDLLTTKWKISDDTAREYIYASAVKHSACTTEKCYCRDLLRKVFLERLEAVVFE
jgi:hypothetical protein